MQQSNEPAGIARRTLNESPWKKSGRRELPRRYSSNIAAQSHSSPRDASWDCRSALVSRALSIKDSLMSAGPAMDVAIIEGNRALSNQPPLSPANDESCKVRAFGLELCQVLILGY
jgi:hypothetical protein